MKLTESDRRLLAAVGPDPQDVAHLAADFGESRADLADRLDEMAENGLVQDLGAEGYQRTESGRRLVMTGGGEMDEAIDTTPAIEEVIAGLDLAPDAADAVRGAYAFLRYWGDGTADEIIDAVYPEWPAGYDSPESWWSVVSDGLAAIPEIARPNDERESVAAIWHHTGTPEAAVPGSNGFLPSELRGEHPYGSVKHALESIDLDGAERTAVQAAFSVLRQRGEASDDEFREVVYPDHQAGYETAAAWWNDLVRAAFVELPGVEHVEESDGDRWRYELPPTE